MRKIIIVFICFLALAGCTAPQKTSTDLINHIPENASLVVSIQNPQAFFNALRNNSFLQEHPFLPPGLSRKLEPLKLLDKKNGALLCIVRSSDSLYDYAYISRDTRGYALLDSIKDGDTKELSVNGLPVKEVSAGDQRFYNALADSIFISSSSEKLITDNIAARSTRDREKFRKVYNLANKDKQASFFLKDYLSSPLNLTLTDSIQHPANSPEWAMFDLSLSPGELLLTGIVPDRDSLYGNTSAGASPRKIVEIAPAKARGVLSLPPDGLYLPADSISPSPVNDLLATADEVGIIFGETYDALAFHTFDTDIAAKAFSASAVLSTTFRDHNIYRMDPVAPFPQAQPPFGKGKEFAFYTALEDFIILAGTSEALTDIIVNYQSKSTLNHQSPYAQVREGLSGSSSMLLVGMHPDFKKQCLQNILRPYTGNRVSPDISADFPYLVVQGIADKDFIHTNILLKKPGQSGTVAGISQKFNIALDADIATSPQLVVNHLNKQKEVVVQDVEHQLYLISGEGKVLWKKALSGRILGKIEQVDLFGNGRLQLAFTLSDGLYVIDRNGKDVSPFPVKVQKPITRGLALFDYDKNRKYRFFITQENVIVPFNSHGKRVSGFNFSGTASPIINPPVHLRTGARDYIAVQEENGTLHLLHRTGSRRVQVNGKIDFSGNRIYLYQDRFTTTNKAGDLIQADERGRLNKTGLGLAEGHRIDATARTLVTLSDNILTIKQNTYELDYGIYTGPDIFYINNKIYVALTDIQSNQVYLFDSNALLLGNFPVYGTSAIDLGDMDGDGHLKFVTQGEKDKIIVYEIK